MTPGNAQPTVITAAEFVSGGYAQRVAAGECVASFDGFDVDEVLPYTSFPGYKYAICYAGYERVVPIQKDALISLYQVEPNATPATDERASLRAQVARYRAALEAIVSSAIAYEESVRDPIGEVYRGNIDGRNAAARIARDALAETEEA